MYQICHKWCNCFTLKCLHTICKQSLCLCYWWQRRYIVANWFVSYVIRRLRLPLVCILYLVSPCFINWNFFMETVWHAKILSVYLFSQKWCLIWTTETLFGMVPKRRQLIARTNACVKMIQFTDAHMEHQGLFITWMTLFAAWISNYILYKVWVWYTCPFSILNVVAVGVVNG